MQCYCSITKYVGYFIQAKSILSIIHDAIVIDVSVFVRIVMSTQVSLPATFCILGKVFRVGSFYFCNTIDDLKNDLNSNEYIVILLYIPFPEYWNPLKLSVSHQLLLSLNQNLIKILLKYTSKSSQQHKCDKKWGRGQI